MGENRKELVGARFEPEEVEEIEARADAEDITKSEFVRRAVRRELGDKSLADRVEILEEVCELLLEKETSSGGTHVVTKSEELLNELQSDN
jgi:hypothetical protein